MDIPRIRFGSDPTAQTASAIFAETLQDMLDKVDDGTADPRFEKGYFHTSTLQHEGTCYYGSMWLRDAGRGLVELARLGFAEQALDVSRYLLRHLTFGDHWGREVHGKRHVHELDGNALALLGIARTWIAAGRDASVGAEFLEGLRPVLEWALTAAEQSPYDGLMPSISELSGNPNAPYPVYGVWGNYAMHAALRALDRMASALGDLPFAERARQAAGRIEKGLSKLISDGKFSYAEAGCWFNGLDGRDGRAYDTSEWDGTAWPIWHWTRQLPFICDADLDIEGFDGPFSETHRMSYRFLRRWMNTGAFFRKYGFVSNSGWSGMGGRHDETMCGYGQGFFTQAALMADDVNVYTKCLEGISRLGYDGSVTDPLSFEMDPWVMHECFSYENYETGRDHTFGAEKNGRREIMQNPGDEGNLVQEAEILKAFAMVVGVRLEGSRLIVAPRLPWNWDELEVRDWPLVGDDGRAHRVGMLFRHERWLRKCSVRLTGIAGIPNVSVRFGPFATTLREREGLRLERGEKASWLWKDGSDHRGALEWDVTL
jgi:hypothetical protein